MEFFWAQRSVPPKLSFFPFKTKGTIKEKVTGNEFEDIMNPPAPVVPETASEEVVSEEPKTEE